MAFLGKYDWGMVDIIFLNVKAFNFPSWFISLDLLGSLEEIFYTAQDDGFYMQNSKIKKEQGCWWKKTKHQVNLACGFETFLETLMSVVLAHELREKICC